MEVLGIVSLVLGILSIIGSYWYVGIFLSLIGLVLGAVSVSDSLSSGKLISAMGILTSILGIVMTAYFVASDLDSEKLVVQAEKFTKGKEQPAERDDFMRFHKDVAAVEETDVEKVEEETEDRQETEQEEGITPYWISDSTEEERKPDSEYDSVVVQPEEDTRESRDREEGNENQRSSIFKVGETAESNDIEITLISYKESQGSEFNNPSSGNEFVLAQFEIVNNSDSEIAVSSLLSFDAYADDYALDYSVGALVENEEGQLDGSIAAGKRMKGWVGWEANTNWKEIEIHFTEDFWNNNKFIFLISK